MQAHQSIAAVFVTPRLPLKISHATYIPLGNAIIGTRLEIGKFIVHFVYLFFLHKAYIDAGCPKKKEKEFQNFTHPPLLTGDPEQLVLDVINIPSLHILIGKIIRKHIFLT